MNELGNVLSKERLEKLKRWCLLRQDGGFHGRPGKQSDSCYSFWIGATLKLLGVDDLSDCEENRAFVLDTQNALVGGFGKYASEPPDPLHAYLGNYRVTANMGSISHIFVIRAMTTCCFC